MLISCSHLETTSPLEASPDRPAKLLSLRARKWAVQKPQLLSTGLSYTALTQTARNGAVVEDNRDPYCAHLCSHLKPHLLKRSQPLLNRTSSLSLKTHGMAVVGKDNRTPYRAHLCSHLKTHSPLKEANRFKIGHHRC
ncbi:hypothetical protein AVEN_250491-1 [Araneus ventricosus]|uniref:Uncharacterized protein n=1 Tax=Araneus ventricosus TaxID=182803 RepID=A0A4Y2QVW6_ARAVE|nr:hypothetical protein AVEN_250491-1 [Araneus ventricosus]